VWHGRYTVKVATKATKAARTRHAAGTKRLGELFGFTQAKASLNPQTGRAIPDRKVRRVWKAWRDETFPARVHRRRRRKLARASRKRNRS